MSPALPRQPAAAPLPRPGAAEPARVSAAAPFLRDCEPPADGPALRGREESLRAALVRAPGDARSMGLLGDLLRARGELVEAESLLRATVAAARRDPARAPLVPDLLRLATAVQYAGRHEEAGALFREALERTAAPEWAGYRDFALQHQGKCLAEQGRLSEARECFLQARALREAKGDEGLLRSTRAALEELARRESALSSGPGGADRAPAGSPHG